ncbi:hypothetical protein BBJ28_00025640, partial [Nothophytophthora sp. Chile5]
MEAKVSFHVRRYLRECEDRGARPSEATVTAHLRDTYAEYQRKPQGALKRVVAKVLKKAQPSLVSAEDGASSATDAAKRARAESEEEDERQVLALEQQRAPLASNSLNNAIRQNYAASNEAAASASTSGKPAIKKAKLRKRSKESAADADADTAADGDESRGFVVERPTTRYSDFGGIHAVLQEVRELIEYPLTHPEVYAHLGVEPPRGVLLHGPPGTGKSMLAHAIAGECGATFLKISAPEVVSGMSGESEQKLRALFDEAVARAPSIVFIDEIDAITPKRETSQRGMEKRIVAQLLTSTDALSLENTGGKPVLLIGATNRPDALDSALRRAGRFDREICLGIPDEQAREKILQVLAQKMTLEGDFDFAQLARRTPGFVGADLVSLTKEAAVGAVNRIFSSILPEKPTKKETSETTDASTETEAGATSTSDVSASDEAMDTETEAKPVETNEDVERTPSAADDLRAQVTPFTKAQLAPLSITMSDFVAAVAKVQPSAKREGFATIP